MKWLTTCICIISGTFSFAQNFDWLSTGHNIELDVRYASINSKNEMLVISEGRTKLHIDGPTELTSATMIDTTIKISASQRINPNESYTFSSYDASGNFLWVNTFSNRFIDVFGLDCNKAGEFEVLCYLNEIYDKEDINDFTGEESDEDDSESDESYSDLDLFDGGSVFNPRYVRCGYYVITMDSGGKMKKATLIADETVGELDISSFRCTPQNGYLLAGHFDDDLNLPMFAKQKKTAGGDFIFVYNQKGEMSWGQLGSYQGNSCCGYYANSLHTAIAPDGTIYLSGETDDPIEFSNGKKVNVKVTDTKQNRSDLPESYIACFDTQGKMSWLKQSNSPVFI